MGLRQTRRVVGGQGFEDLYRREVRALVSLASSMTGDRETAARADGSVVQYAMLG
jgi:hypothetical protein